MTLEFYTSVAKKLKLKVRKFLGLIPTFVGNTEEKLVRGSFLPPSPPNSFVWCFEKALGFQKDSETNFASQFYWQSKGQEKNQNQHKCYFGPNLHLAFTFQNSFQHDLDILLYQNYFPQKMFLRSGNVL